MIELLNMDCMDYMAGLKDNAFELAIVDPPYGMGQRYNFRYHDDPNKKDYVNIAPDKFYFDEVKRVSNNFIIWGATYFTDKIPLCKHWVCWLKGNPIPSFSDFEMAATSFDKADVALKLDSYGFNHADRKLTGNSTIHPTQKPVQLYEWLLKNYAKEGDRILDTHLGSASSAIAAHNYGFDFVGIELDKDYYDAAVKRFEQHKAQLKILW